MHNACMMCQLESLLANVMKNTWVMEEHVSLYRSVNCRWIALINHLHIVLGEFVCAMKAMNETVPLKGKLIC